MAEPNQNAWCNEIDGDVFFAIGDNEKGQGQEFCPHVRAALALNEECCVRGFGRFYVFVSHGVNKRVKRIETAVSLSRVPEIFYVPEIWTESEKREWKSLDRRGQMSRTCARNGWIWPDHQPVLPIRLDVHKEQLPNPRFEALTLAPILVFFSPSPYVAPITEIQALGQLRQMGGKSRQWVYEIDGGPDGWSSIAQWKCQGMADVVTRIERFYRDSAGVMEERLVSYMSLVKRFAGVRVAAEDIKGAS